MSTNMPSYQMFAAIVSKKGEEGFAVHGELGRVSAFRAPAVRKYAIDESPRRTRVESLECAGPRRESEKPRRCQTDIQLPKWPVVHIQNRSTVHALPHMGRSSPSKPEWALCGA
jgi:hypothetical protein